MLGLAFFFGAASLASLWFVARSRQSRALDQKSKRRQRSTSLEQTAAIFSIIGTVIALLLAGPELAAYVVNKNTLFSDSKISMPNIIGKRHFQATQDLRLAGVVNITYKLRGQDGDEIVDERWIKEPSCVIVEQTPPEGESILPRDSVVLTYKEGTTPDGIYDWGESLRAESSDGRAVLVLKQAIVKNGKVKFGLRFEPIIAPIDIPSLTTVKDGEIRKHSGVVIEDDLGDAYGIPKSGGIWNKRREITTIYEEAHAEISNIDILRPGARAYRLKVNLETSSTDFDPFDVRFSDAKYIPLP